MGEGLSTLVKEDKAFYDRTGRIQVTSDHQQSRQQLLSFLLDYVAQSSLSQKGMYQLNKNTLKALHQLGHR